jgi:hypothetical protein
MYWEGSMKLIRSLSLLAVLILAGCSSSTLGTGAIPAPAEGQPPPALIEQLPPLPGGPQPRTASLIGPLTLPGSMAIQDFGLGVSYGASSVTLTPPAGQLAGAMYCLPVNAFSYDEITFDITFDDPARLWLGVADYQRGCWDLRVASPGITSTTPPYPTSRSPYGFAYLFVLAWDDTTVVVHEVAINPNIPTWQQHLIDDQAGVGGDLDMTRIGDYLYVAYDLYESMAPDTELRLARATESAPTETGHWDRTLIDGSNDAEGLDLALVNGLPALIFSES